MDYMQQMAVITVIDFLFIRKCMLINLLLFSQLFKSVALNIFGFALYSAAESFF